MLLFLVMDPFDNNPFFLATLKDVQPGHQNRVGPTAMTSLLLIKSREPHRLLEWLVALILAWLLTAVIIPFSTSSSRILGERGLVALDRLMGMVLVTITVQMIPNGLERFLAGL